MSWWRIVTPLGDVCFLADNVWKQGVLGHYGRVPVSAIVWSCPDRTFGPRRSQVMEVPNPFSYTSSTRSKPVEQMATARAQRRLAAILSADVVGYSRLMGADEAGTLAVLKTHRHELIDPKVEEYSGRVVKLMGDGMLAEFPSVVDAVQCAVDIQQRMVARNVDSPADSRIEFRVGINIGDVIIDGDDIYGDGVNIAARLQEAAEPGGVYVSGDVYRQVEGKVGMEFQDLGERELKNIENPVRAYKVVEGAELLVPGAKSIDASTSRPGVAVLPFDNISGDPEQEYFSDGLTEDIITSLAAWRSFPVVARNSTFAYKNQSPDVRQVAEDLNVRYVLEGSVRKSGNRVRITAQLIDGLTGNHLWANRYVSIGVQN